jgi:3D (Asp-Asp-Asp) domain-containing protein
VLPNSYYLLQPSERGNKNQVETKKDFNDTVSASIREVTAYNVGDPKQNHGNPCISANGENICAANFVSFGTQLYIAHYGVCTVTDRMNRRYRNRVDIAMKVTEKDKALQFGLKKLKVTILTLQRYLLIYLLDIFIMICHTTKQPLNVGGKPCYQLLEATNTCTQFQSLTLARAI